MQVREHMSPAPITISADVDVHTALRLLQERVVRRLPVTDASGRVLGIVTERDLLLAVSHYLSIPIEVEAIMTRPVVATTPDALLADAAMLMVNHKIGGLPVVDTDQPPAAAEGTRRARCASGRRRPGCGSSALRG